jgi:mannitol-specific phosphotransferase system IIBC component
VCKGVSGIMAESILGVLIGFVVAFISIYLTMKVENKKDYNRWDKENRKVQN